MYRSDLDAALSRIDALEAENARLAADNARLRQHHDRIRRVEQPKRSPHRFEDRNDDPVGNTSLAIAAAIVILTVIAFLVPITTG